MARASFGWAIVGPGRIAHRFAEAVQRLPGTQLVAVHGRDAGRAAAFAQRWATDDSISATESLDTVLRDPRVDAVYIATPHAFHAEAARACLRAGKPVLCEKPLTVNLRLGEELVALSRQHGAFLMEGLWTRFLPIHEQVARWLADGAIGRIRGLQSSFSFPVPFDPHGRHFDAAQAGGAILDIGIYNLSVTQACLRHALGVCPLPTRIQASGLLAETGVDRRVTATLQFPDGISSQLFCGFDGPADNGFRIFGESGVITLPHRFWEATHATLQRGSDEPIALELPFAINGFEGQIVEAMACIRRGELESLRVPHADTLALLSWMDEIRRQLGVVYPFE